MKKLFVLFLSGIMLTSSVPMSSYAAISENTKAEAISIRGGEPSSGSKVEPTNSALESAIIAVKNKITIPEAYSEFNYYFSDSNSYSDSYWSLTWRNSTTNAYIQVNIDAKNHITNFHQYDGTNKGSGIAKFLKTELKAKADDYIKKIAPETMNKLEYVDATFEGIYSGNYVYNYKRVNNGVEFPDNTVSVSVNSVSGEVAAASINWIYDAKVPSETPKLSENDAIKLIKENMKMKLVYRTNNYRIYDKNDKSPSEAFLVYEPTENYISVDAKTGEVYLTRSEWVDTVTRNDAKEEAATADTALKGSGSTSLTEEEIAKIEELKGLISKAKAIETVTKNSSLYLDKNLKSSTATLNKWENGDEENSYVWNISLNDPRKINYETDTDYYRAYAYATVDAKTGKILSYYASVKSYYDEMNQKWNTVKIQYNKEEARKKLEMFLKTQVKDRFDNSILSEQNDDYIAYYKDKDPVYGGYSYQYNRVNENVEYSYNGIYGSVDGITGKIYSFGSNWDYNLVFESTKGVMMPEEAMVQYLNKDGFELKYEINVINKFDSSKSKELYLDNNYTVEYEIRLVYRPDINPSSISPFTGEQLDYTGEVYKETKPYQYKDVSYSATNRNIFLMADMNIGFAGEEFLPEISITKGELDKLLELVGYGYYNEAKDDTKAEQLITREEIAHTFIDKLGYGELSKLSGIYKTGYNDENNIDDKFLGAVALAKGLGLIEADKDNNFNAKSKVTRFDAVQLIFNFIEAQTSRMYN